MSFGRKLLGILKISGLTLGLCCGSILTGIGLPLYFVGGDKIESADEGFQNTTTYIEARAEEDERLKQIENKLEEIEISFDNDELSVMDYQFLKKGYQAEIEDSKENFYKDLFWTKADDEFKGMVKSGEGMQIASVVLMVMGGFGYLLKASSFIASTISEGTPSEFIGEAIISTMQDVVDEDIRLSYWEEQKKEEKKKRKLEKKKLKEEEKQRKEKEKKKEEEEKKFKSFIEEDEEEDLKNIDEYYRD